MTLTRFSQALHYQLTLFRVALQFLTVLPISPILGFRSDWLVQSTRYFWLVGLMIGAISTSVASLIFGHLSVWLSMLIVLFTSVLITGGLHEDALADAADGLLGGRSIEKRLEIMKDSRVGTYGVLALWFSLSTKWVCMHDLALNHIVRFLAVLMVAPSLARVSAVGLLHVLPYVQTERSKGAGFARATRGAFDLNLVAGAMLSFLLLGPLFGFACIVVSLLLTFANGSYFRSKIGGISGDCIGANIQIVELGCYFAVLILSNAGTDQS